jgi:hypothetical protein
MSIYHVKFIHVYIILNNVKKKFIWQKSNLDHSI